MLKVSLQHAGGARFIAEPRHHRIVLDQPAEDGATDQGMSPAELLLVALGGCAGQYVTQYLTARGFSSEGVQVTVEVELSSRSLHLGDFHLGMIVPSLNECQLRALERSFPAGLVQNAIQFENILHVTAASQNNESQPLAERTPRASGPARTTDAIGSLPAKVPSPAPIAETQRR